MRDHSEHTEANDDELSFFPNVLLVEFTLAVAVIGLLTIFVSLFPLKLGEKFDLTNPPTVLEPEWYFMAMYQFLKTENVQPLHGIILSVILGFFLILVPFLDRGSERRPLRRPMFTAIALILIAEFLAMTIYGYVTPGQVAALSESGFMIVFLATNLVALGLVFLVLMAHRRTVRGAGS